MSEFEEYKKLGEPNKKEKSEIWETAIGLQQVDGLKPSAYLIQIAKANIEGDITFEEVKAQISGYYEEKGVTSSSDKETKEADLVSARIAEILSEKTFVFNIAEYLTIHKRLFEGIYEFAGKIRDFNIEKKEWVLDGESVTYGSFSSIRATLDHDFKEEKGFSFKGLNKKQAAEHISNFISRIWQIHAFGEGNTRTTAVFLVKYLRTLGFDVDNTLFAENSWFFRNALVRANYTNFKNEIYATNDFLDKFFENLLLNTKHTLKNRDLHVKNDTAKVENDTLNDTKKHKSDTIKIKNNTVNDTVFSLIKNNNTITAKEIGEKLNCGIATVKRKIKQLKESGKIERIGSDKTGSWKILKAD